MGEIVPNFGATGSLDLGLERMQTPPSGVTPTRVFANDGGEVPH